MMNPSTAQLHLKKYIILGLVLSITIGLLLWLWNHSFVTIELSQQPQGTVTIEVYDQKTGKTLSKKADKTSIRLLTTRGNKEVLVKDSGSNYFEVISASGFLRSTNVTANVQPEKSRRFVGDNPGPCMQYANETLFSYPCTGNLDDISIHQPPTTSEPGYTLSPKIEGHSGPLIGAFIRDNHFVAISQTENEGDEPGLFTYTAYIIDVAGNVIGEELLNGIPAEGTYVTVPFKDGLLFYNEENYEKVWQVSSALSVTPITLQAPQDTSYYPVGLKASGDSIMSMYAEEKAEDLDLHEDSQPDVKMEIIVSGTANGQRVALNKYYTDVSLCGENKLCLFYGKRLEVRDLTQDDTPRLYEVHGVDSLLPGASGTIVVVRGSELLSLNVKEKRGSAIYNYGEYTMCGSGHASRGYLLCLINKKQDRMALFIDPSVKNADSIDQKINELAGLKEVDSITAHGNIIYISPEIGDRVYDPAAGIYTYNKDKIKKSNDVINAKLSQLALPLGYTVVNTTPN